MSQQMTKKDFPVSTRFIVAMPLFRLHGLLKVWEFSVYRGPEPNF